MTNTTAKRLALELMVKTIGDETEQATEFGVVLISHGIEIYQLWGGGEGNIKIRKKFAKFLRGLAEPLVNPPRNKSAAVFPPKDNRLVSAEATASDLCLRIVGGGGSVIARQTTEFGLVMQSHGIQLCKIGDITTNNAFGRFLVSWAEGIEEEWAEVEEVHEGGKVSSETS